MRYRIPARRAKKKPSKKVKGWCSGGGVHLATPTKLAHAYLDKVGSRCREDEEHVAKLQKRWTIRCFDCGRRLHPKKQVFGSEREFFNFVIPAHKVK